MKIRFYMACAFALTLHSCQKDLLQSAAEQKLNLPAISLKNSLAESDDFFTTGFKPSADYQMMFTERFITNNIDTTKMDNSGDKWWNARVGDVVLSNPPFTAHNRASNNSVANGVLSIKFNKDANGYYYGGGVISKKTFGYGYYEARVKLYTGSLGLHQSFWSIGPAIEIDGFETDSKRKTILSTLHPGRHRWKPLPLTPGAHDYYHENTTETSAYVQVPNTNLANPPANDDGIWDNTDGIWYTVGYEWLPGQVNYYVNGVLKTSFGLQDSFGNSVDVFQPANVALTALPYKLYTDLDMGTPQPGAKMQVEYFAYYAKKLANTNLLGNNQFSSVSKVDLTEEAQATSWVDTVLKVNDVALYGNSALDKNNSHVLKIGDKWCLEQKNTTQAFKAENYQTLNFVLPGTYKLSADIRCSGAGSKFIVLDKDKSTILATRTIMGPHPETINIVMDNIPVTNNEITVLIYSDLAQGAWLQVDNISFAIKP